MSNNSKNKRVRYTVNDISNNRFFQMPKFLFEGEFKECLNSDAKCLYMLLRDRHELSIVNNWINEKNEVYLIYTRKELEKMLGISDKTVKKAIEQLKNCGLMDEEHQGLNKPNLIYLSSVDLGITGHGNFPTPDTEILRLRSRKFSDSRIGEFPIQESENFRLINTDSNNTDSNDTDNQSINHVYMSNQLQSIDRLIEEKYSMEFLRKKFETKIMEQSDKLYTELTELIYDVVNDTRETIKVNSRPMPIEAVKSRFMKLTVAHLEYVVDTFSKQTQKISNVRQYLITALYNSYTTIDSYYKNAVNHDLYGSE